MPQFDSQPLTRRTVLATPAAFIGLASLCSAGPAGWNDADLMEPKALAQRLTGKGAGKPPVMFHVGFNVLYRSKHIPNSAYAGPGNKPEGMEMLKKAVAALPKTQEIVLYCGCCPWVNCPNMKTSFALLRDLGFKNVKALMIETNFSQDWVQKGYPVENGSAGA